MSHNATGSQSVEFHSYSRSHYTVAITDASSSLSSLITLGFWPGRTCWTVRIDLIWSWSGPLWFSVLFQWFVWRLSGAFVEQYIPAKVSPSAEELMVWGFFFVSFCGMAPSFRDTTVQSIVWGSIFNSSHWAIMLYLLLLHSVGRMDGLSFAWFSTHEIFIYHIKSVELSCQSRLMYRVCSSSSHDCKWIFVDRNTSLERFQWGYNVINMNVINNKNTLL